VNNPLCVVQDLLIMDEKHSLLACTRVGVRKQEKGKKTLHINKSRARTLRGEAKLCNEIYCRAEGSFAAFSAEAMKVAGMSFLICTCQKPHRLESKNN
jgi:hypothetical protein